MPIASLHKGDLVYSVDHGHIAAVPIARTNRAPAHHHVVMRFELANGSTLEISGGHPTADGRHFADLDRGDLLGGVRILRARAVAYHHAFTYDILPASDTGTYFAGGVLIGSTLAPPNQCVAAPGPLPAAALRPAR